MLEKPSSDAPPSLVILDCAGKHVALDGPRVMGILNVTPDSFSDGGRFDRLDSAVARAWEMVENGAAIIDVGGESTRPGADALSPEAELARVIPILEALADLPVPISVDTSKPAVMLAAADAGAGMINDVCALQQPGALDAAAATGLPVCVMHMQGEPRTMQRNPHYQDVVAEVAFFLKQRQTACVDAGIARDQIVLDPGFGFGKTLEHNFQLMAGIGSLVRLGPVLIGVSRKSMFQMLLDRPVDARLAGSLAAATLLAAGGARIARAHDVAATVDALAVVAAVREQASR